MAVSERQDWKEIVRVKQETRALLIPAEWRITTSTGHNPHDFIRTCGVLDEKQLAITETSATKLVQQLRDRTLTSVEVTLAFCKRAAVAHQLVNCLTEICFEEALSAAKELDEEYARTGRPRGALHGLPVSLKDTFRIAGLDTTIGFVAFANSPATRAEESEITRIMRETGAVLYCKTNVPTAMMMSETYNNLWGYTPNPFNLSLSSGGSSGGEAALLALRGSPLGVGTDIGGSIRIPASFCGLYSLKPSFGRFPTLGARSGLLGQEAVRGVNGPMSSDLDSLELWAKAVVGSEPWKGDPNGIPLPWRIVDLPVSGLVFGLIGDNGVIRPTPPVERALKLTRNALIAAGHRVIDWEPYEAQRSMTLLEQLFSGDGGRHIHDIIESSGEPWLAGLALFKQAYESRKDTPALASDLWRLQAERLEYAKAALDLWRSSQDITGTGRPFDGVISPVTPWPACPQYKFGGDVSYTSMWNLLDQPAVTFPVTTVDQIADVRPEYTPRNDRERHVWETYNLRELEDAPVSLQIIGSRLEEERTLALAKIIVESLRLTSSTAKR